MTCILFHIYVEFLNKTYGMQKVMQLIKNQDYSKTFGKRENDIYKEFIQFFKLNYMN